MHNRKLPSSWRDFATILKHKRQKISVENLIASLDVEEKARAKDASEKEDEGNSSANMVQKHHPHSKNKKVAHKPVKILPSRRRRRQRMPKKISTHAVIGDTSQETVQLVHIARQRLILDQNPRMST